IQSWLLAEKSVQTRELSGIMAEKFAELHEWDFSQWSASILPGFCIVIVVGMEILSHIVPIVFGSTTSGRIPIKAKHLDEFSSTDTLFIWINKLLTSFFVYHLLYVCYYSPTIKWQWSEATMSNTLGSLVLFYIFYDFFYMNFHRILHIKELYSIIHKHHHRQKAPSRGNLDAINVHPFEFFVGEYLHLVTVYFIPCHMYAVAFFIIVGGVLASLNHTRYDIVIPGLYSVKVHDVHHRLPESNYGQYIMLWDYLFGSYRPYGTKIPPSSD
ncbi:fatty acid hydroxylase family protein, partial [archaeon]